LKPLFAYCVSAVTDLVGGLLEDTLDPGNRSAWRHRWDKLRTLVLSITISLLPPNDQAKFLAKPCILLIEDKTRHARSWWFALSSEQLVFGWKCAEERHPKGQALAHAERNPDPDPAGI